jgi:hypothetical protein
MNTRRCVDLFVTQGLRPRKANASAKHVKVWLRHGGECKWGCAAGAIRVARIHARWGIAAILLIIRAREGSFYAMSEIPSSQKVLSRFIRDRDLLNVCYPMCNDRIIDSLYFN